MCPHDGGVSTSVSEPSNPVDASRLRTFDALHEALRRLGRSGEAELRAVVVLEAGGQARRQRDVTGADDLTGPVVPAALIGGAAELISAVLSGRLRLSRRRVVDRLSALWVAALAPDGVVLADELDLATLDPALLGVDVVEVRLDALAALAGRGGRAGLRVADAEGDGVLRDAGGGPAARRARAGCERSDRGPERERIGRNGDLPVGWSR